MAVLTNKPVGASRGILQGLGLAGHFRFVYGGNSFERKKPDPMGVETILREFGAAPPQVMFVGDSEIDVQTARNAGTWVCGVTYGFGSHRLAEYPPDLLVDSLTELLPHFSGNRASAGPVRALRLAAKTTPRCASILLQIRRADDSPAHFLRGRYPPGNRGCLLRAAERISPWRAGR